MNKRSRHLNKGGSSKLPGRDADSNRDARENSERPDVRRTISGVSKSESRSPYKTPQTSRRAPAQPPTVRRSSTFVNNPFSKAPISPSEKVDVRRRVDSPSRPSIPVPADTPVKRRSSQTKKTYSDSKRDKRQVRARKRFFMRIGLSVVGMILFGLAVWGIVTLINSDIFAIEEVKITGNSHVDSTYIAALSSVPTSTTSTVRADTKTMPGDIPKHPWVSSVEVKKHLPHTIEIIVKERTPSAIVSVPQGGQWLISSEGIWLDQLADDKLSTISKTNPRFNVAFNATALPVIEDMPLVTPREGRRTESKEVLNALSVLSGISTELRDQVIRLQAVSIAKTKLFTVAGVEIAFGSADQAETKDKIARSILDTQKGKVVLINVRTPEKPTWRGLLTD